MVLISVAAPAANSTSDFPGELDALLDVENEVVIVLKDDTNEQDAL